MLKFICIIISKRNKENMLSRDFNCLMINKKNQSNIQNIYMHFYKNEKFILNSLLINSL